jgi:hypothetical protein
MSGLPVRWRFRAAVLCAVVPPLLEIMSFSKLARWLTSDPEHPRYDARDLDDQALAHWVDGWLFRLPWPWRRTCLRRAAVLYALLRRAGRPTELWIGVRREKPGTPMVAHAWLTLDGAPYVEPDPQHPARHTPIAHFPDLEPAT